MALIAVWRPILRSRYSPDLVSLASAAKHMKHKNLIYSSQTKHLHWHSSTSTFLGSVYVILRSDCHITQVGFHSLTSVMLAIMFLDLLKLKGSDSHSLHYISYTVADTCFRCCVYSSYYQAVLMNLNSGEWRDLFLPQLDLAWCSINQNWVFKLEKNKPLSLWNQNDIHSFLVYHAINLILS